MPALTCPHCGVYARFAKVWERKSDPEDPWYDPAACYTCDHCSKPIAVIPNAYGMISQYWPTNVKGRDFPEVPKALADAASQAHLCLSAGAAIGAVAVARAVVEAIAKAHGIIKGDLKAKIERLHAEGHISATMRDAATEIRFAGNEAAHGDLVDERPGVEDAAEIVGLMDSMLYRVYQEPASVAKIRTKRELRQQKAREKALLGVEPGDRVSHDSYGLGTVLSVKGQSDDPEPRSTLVARPGSSTWCLSTRRCRSFDRCLGLEAVVNDERRAEQGQREDDHAEQELGSGVAAEGRPLLPHGEWHPVDDLAEQAWCKAPDLNAKPCRGAGGRCRNIR